MTQTTVGFVAAVLACAGLVVACAQTKRSLGEDCLKSEDCLSGICSQLVCVGAPTTTDNEDYADGGAPVEASPGVDAAAEAADEAASEASPGEAAVEASSGD